MLKAVACNKTAFSDIYSKHVDVQGNDKSRGINPGFTDASQLIEQLIDDRMRWKQDITLFIIAVKNQAIHNLIDSADGRSDTKESPFIHRSI